MRAVIERDLSQLTERREFFKRRAVIAAAGVAGLVWASIVADSQDPDVLSLTIFTSVSTLAMIALVLIVPGTLSQAMERERATNAAAVLMSTPYTSGMFVTGLWTSRLVPSLLYATLVFPFLFLCLTLGGVTPSQCFAACALFILAPFWLCALGITAGALTREAHGAGRVALLLSGLVALFVPTIATWLPAPFDEWVAMASPFTCLKHIFESPVGKAYDRYWSTVGIHALITTVFTVTGLFIAARAFRSERFGRQTLRSASRPVGRLLVPLQHRFPMAWFGLSRHFPSRLNSVFLFAVGLVCLAETWFFFQVKADIADSGDAFGDATSLGGRATIHRTLIFGYALAAMLLGMFAGALSLHRELKTHTLDILYATPLTNHSMTRGLAAGALAPTLPLILLSLIHAIVSSIDGILSPIGALLYFVTLPISVLSLVVRALDIGFQSKDGASAVGKAFLALARVTFICFFFSCLPVAYWFHPVGLAFAPVLVGSGFFGFKWFVWPPALILIPTMFYAWSIHSWLSRRLADHFVIRIDPRQGLRSKAKRERIVRRARKPDGQERSL